MKIKRFKIISIVLLMIFLSQQISWACGYNLSLLVNPPPSSLIYKDHGEFNLWVAKRVYSLTKPSFRHNPQDLKSAYQWLKTPATETVPCSAYVLYNLLQAKGIKPKIEDISASLISLDLKAGNLKPPFTQNRIDNSLYAMAKTAKSQGIELYPVKFALNPVTPKLLNSLNSQTPFIAHLSSLEQGHFVLVTKIDTEKVYFFYDKGDTFLPYEKFLEEFSGYCLLSSASVGTAQCAVPTIADSEAKSILGAGRSYHGRSVNISGVFKKPSSIESVIGIASSIGGAFFMPAGNLWATAAGAGIQVGGGLLFKDSMWGRIATGVAAGAVSGGLSGSTFQGALGLSWGFKEAGIGAAKGLGMSGTIEGIKAMKFGDASLRASIANLLAIPVGQAIEGGLSAKFGATIDGIDYKKETSGSFWKGAWMGATFQRSLTNKADGWKRWAPAIAYYGGQSTSIAVEAFGPKKYSSLYSTGISTAFNALTNVAAMGQGDKLWKVLGKSVADGALRGGLSIGLQKLTKDMRITEGAFLEMAGASLISAGVESAFGKWSGDSAVSRKGIFWDNLQKSWKGAMQDVVTFGAAKGYMLGTSGSYAFLKMHELGSNVGKARASGLSAFDSVHWAFNQHVGSTYHNAAVNTLSNMVWNRVDNVKYMRKDGEIHEIKLQSLSKFTNDKDLLKSGGTVIYDLTTQEYMPQTFTYDDKSTRIVKSISIDESGLLPADYSSDDNNDPIFMSDNEFLKIERKLLRDKIRGKYKISKNMKGLRDPAFTKEDFMIKYPEVEKELKETVLFNPRQKAALTYDLHKTWDIAYERFSAEEKNAPKNVVKLLVQKRDNDSTTKTWKVVHHNRDTVFRMRHGSINEGQIVEGAPDITVRYDPKAGRYEVVVDKKKFKVDRVEDFVTVGDEKLRRVMEAGSTRFPDVEGGLPNAIPGKDSLELKDSLEPLAFKLKKEDKIILNSNQDPETDQSQHAKGNFPLFPGYQLKPGATEAEKIPGYDENIKGRMIYGNKEDPAIMSKQRKDGSVEFNFIGENVVSDVFKIEGIKAQSKKNKIKIGKELSPTRFVEFADKIKWNQGARAAESLPDGRTTYTETMVDVAIISPASVPTPLPVASETATATSSPTLTPVASHKVAGTSSSPVVGVDIKKINEKGIEYGKKGMYDQAIKEFKKVAAIEPDMANVHYNLGLAYKKKGMLTEADAEFRKYDELKNPKPLETKKEELQEFGNKTVPFVAPKHEANPFENNIPHYKPTIYDFMANGYTREEAEILVNQGTGYVPKQYGRGQASTLESAPAKTRGLTSASAGFGEGGSGNKYIQGFIRNEPDTMSDVGQPIISMDKISQAPKVDLQKMSNAQYNKLLSDIDNSGQEDVETMVQHALSPSQMLKDNYGVGKGSLISSDAQPSAVPAVTARWENYSDIARKPGSPGAEWKREEIRYAADGETVNKISRFDDTGIKVFELKRNAGGQVDIYGRGYKDGNSSGTAVIARREPGRNGVPGEIMVQEADGKMTAYHKSYDETGNINMETVDTIDEATGLLQQVGVNDKGERVVKRLNRDLTGVFELNQKTYSQRVRGFDSIGNEITAIKYLDKDDSSVIDTSVDKKGSNASTNTREYFNKDIGLSQKNTVKNNGELSVDRYDDKGEAVFNFYRNRNGEADGFGYNKNGKYIGVQKNRLDDAGNTIIESAVYDKNGRDYTMIEEHYHKESGKKIDRIETKESTPPIIRANIPNDYFSDLAPTSRGAQNTNSAAIIVRKGGAGELTDHGFKVETPMEKIVSGIGDVYRGEFKGAIPPNALIQPKLGTDNIIPRPGKSNGYSYYGIHNDEINK